MDFKRDDVVLATISFAGEKGTKSTDAKIILTHGSLLSGEHVKLQLREGGRDFQLTLVKNEEGWQVKDSYRCAFLKGRQATFQLDKKS